MARSLYETQPRFREIVDRGAKLLADELPRPLLDVLFTPQADASLGDRLDLAAPALFVIEYALAEMWRSWGVEPSAVLGQGVGEYAAATFAGVFELEDGLKLAAARARWEARFS